MLLDRNSHAIRLLAIIVVEIIMKSFVVGGNTASVFKGAFNGSSNKATVNRSEVAVWLLSWRLSY